MLKRRRVPVNVVLVQTVGFSGCKEDYYISWLSSERRDNLELVKERLKVRAFSGWKVGWLVGVVVCWFDSVVQCREQIKMGK